MSLVVETKYGRVRGMKQGNVYVWKGIPYAKAPVGPLRFKPPQPPEPWKGIREATQFGPAAPQPLHMLPSLVSDEIGVSEDCLTLNIWSSGLRGPLKPVLVWIHGGAYVSGTSALSLYDGASFAEKGNLVFVSFNYRLGPLGYLYLGEYGEEYRASGNCGTLDQIAVLRWIRDNIAAFGGDPEQVTVFGQSSGAGSVSVLLSIDEVRTLFQRAILQSWSTASTIDRESAERVTRQFLKILGLQKNPIANLLNMPAEKLAEAVVKMSFVSFRPVIDGLILDQPPLEAVGKGVADGKSLIVGSTRDEYWLKATKERAFQSGDGSLMVEYVREKTMPYWPEIASYYLNNQEAGRSLAERMKRLMTFHMYTYSVEQLITRLVQRPVRLWTYRFDWRSPVLQGALGACHGMELPFVFHTFDSPLGQARTGFTSDRAVLSGIMHGAWSAFASTGNPNGPMVPTWPNCKNPDRACMIFDRHCQVKQDPHRKEREIWDQAVCKAGIIHSPI